MKFFNGLVGLVLSLLPLENQNIQNNQYYSLKKNKEERVEYYHIGKKSLEIYEVPRPRIFRASKYEMGDGLLGVAFPDRDLAVILDSLNGSDFEKVKEHELHHLERPWDSEYSTRESTGTLYWEPNPYVSVT